MSTSGSRRLYLVRHGQSTWNLEGRIQGHVMAPPLTERGRHQARRAALQLAYTGVTMLLSSDASRARQTAEIIGSVLGLSPILTPLLREQHWGGLQGQMNDQAQAIAASLTDEQPIPGGESRHAVRARLGELLRSDVLGSATGPVALVSHGDTIAQAVWLLSGDDLATPANGSVICFNRVGASMKWRGHFQGKAQL